VVLVTVPAVAVKEHVFAPAGTTTPDATAVHGALATTPATGKALGLALVKVTVIPPGGAFPVSVTVPVLVCPETRVVGLKASVETTGASTVNEGVGVAVNMVPLGSVAVTFPVTFAATGKVLVTGKVPLVCPGLMLNVAGNTATVFENVLDRVTVSPGAAMGAGPLSVTIPVGAGDVPPVMEPGAITNEVMVAGLIVSGWLVLMFVGLSDAVTETCCGVGTPNVVSVNCAEVLPAGIVSVGGTLP